MGYRFQAQSESSQSHDIPIGFDLADGDYRRIMAGCEEFVSQHHESPLLFAKVGVAACNGFIPSCGQVLAG